MREITLHGLALLLALGGLLTGGCSPPQPPATGAQTDHAESGISADDQPSQQQAQVATDGSSAAAPAALGPQKMTAEHLPNLVLVHPQVLSGGLPDGDAGFEELVKLNVKTVISVDGAKPDVERAKKFGLRYVHLPHGYDGISPNRIDELAKAVTSLDGPIYIHCHHGKHRSPAAASAACIAAGLIPASAGRSVLELAGTSPHYVGLYRTAERTRPLDAERLEQMNVEFPATAVVPPVAEAMVALEHTHDHLNEIAASGWLAPAAHPDLDPAHEALLLQEHFSELLRTDHVSQQPQKYFDLMKDSEQAAVELTATLRDWHDKAASADLGRTSPPEALSRLSQRITDNCKTCHQTFRDIPRSE